MSWLRKENTKQMVTVPGNNYFQFPYKISTSHQEKKRFLTSCKSSFWNEEGPNNNCNCCSKFKEPESKTNYFLLVNIHSTSGFTYEIFWELLLKNSYTLLWLLCPIWGYPEDEKTTTRQLCCCVVVWSLSVQLFLQPHGLQPTRHLCSWDFPGKNMQWVAISFPRGCSWSRDQTHIYTGRQILHHGATREVWLFYFIPINENIRFISQVYLNEWDNIWKCK